MCPSKISKRNNNNNKWKKAKNLKNSLKIDSNLILYDIEKYWNNKFTTLIIYKRKYLK